MTETGIDLVIETETELDLRLREKFAQFAQDQDLARLSWRQGKRNRQPIANAAGTNTLLLVRFLSSCRRELLQPSQEGGLACKALSATLRHATLPVSPIFMLDADHFTFSLAGRAIIHAVEENSEAIHAVTLAARRGSLVPG